MAVRSTALQQNFACATNDPQLAISGVSGHTKIIKDLVASNSAGSERYLRLYLNGTTSAERLLTLVIPANLSASLTGRFIVLGEDDDLYADQNGSGVTFSAFGAYLVGVVS